MSSLGISSQLVLLSFCSTHADAVSVFAFFLCLFIHRMGKLSTGVRWPTLS